MDQNVLYVIGIALLSSVFVVALVAVAISKEIVKTTEEMRETTANIADIIASTIPDEIFGNSPRIIDIYAREEPIRRIESGQ